MVELFNKYSETDGLRILAFPCNQFGGQEPGTNEEIKAAFTRLARSFHPDKYCISDPALQHEAQELFILVDRAYKVLSHHTERAVYDSFGNDGLHALYSLSNEHKKSTGKPDLELILDPHAVGFVDERGLLLKQKLLRRMHLDREIDAASRFNVRGAIQVNLDGTGVFGEIFEPLNEYDLTYGTDEGFFEGLKFHAPTINDCIVQQSFDALLTSNDSISLGAQT